MRLRNPEETRYRLQEAAEREFARYGFAGARVARIASTELADRLLRTLAAKIEDDPGAAYADTLRAYFEAVCSHPTWARLVFHEALEPSPGFSTAARAPEQRFVATFEPAIRRAQAEGHL